MTRPYYVVYHFEDDPIGLWQEGLSALMPELELVPPGSPDANKAEVLIGWNPPEGVLAGLKALKGVVSLAQGVDHVLLGKDFPPHLKLARLVDPTMSDAMAEWVMLAILERHRDRDAYREAEGRGEWIRLPRRLAEDNTVAVMGLGAIGGTVARKVAMMGFRTIGWSRGPKRIEDVESLRGEDGFEACLTRADYLVSVLPLTAETADLYDRATFGRMKRGAVFINAGRGLQVVEEDLVDAIDSGHLAAAVLDVTRVEPLPEDSPLWTHPKVTVWPHVSAMTGADSAAEQVVEAVRAIRDGREPRNSVDISRGY